MCHKANEVKAKYANKSINDWKRIEDIITYLKPLKRDGDSAIPKNRKAVEQRFSEWSNRCHRRVDINDDIRKRFELWMAENNGSGGKSNVDGKDRK